MASFRRAFFSFHYTRDAWRAAQVRGVAILPNIKTTGRFSDNAAWETVKRQSDGAIKRWIDEQLNGVSVTVVLIGQETASRRWVQYEIAESVRRGKGLLGVRIHNIESFSGPLRTVDRSGPDPFAAVSDPFQPNKTLKSQFPIYQWKPNGRQNLADWIEKAAQAAGR